MAGSKTLAWIRSLDGNEQRAFSKVIEHQRSGKLRKLLDLLLLLPEPGSMPSNADLFVTIFREEYAPEKDYLLRNEIRHLNNALKEFIAGRQGAPATLADLDKEILVLAEFVERGEAENFEKAFKQFVRKAGEEDDPELLAAAWRLQTRLLALRPPLHEPKMRNGLELVAESQMWQRKATLRLQLGEWVHECRFHRMIAATQQRKVELGEAPLQGFKPAELGPLDAYLLQKGKSYGLDSANRMVALQHLEALLAKVSTKKFRREEEEIWLLASLALESYLNKDFEQSIAVFGRLEAIQGIRQHAQWPIICFNQISALLKLRDYPAAFAAMEKLGPSIEKVAVLEDRYRCQKAMNLVFNGRHEQAIAVLKDHVRHTNTDSYIYYRLVSTIAFHKQGNHLAALQEIENLLQATQLRSSKTPINKMMAKLLERYISAHADLPTPKSLKQLKALKQEIGQLDATERDVLVLQWLEEALMDW